MNDTAQDKAEQILRRLSTQAFDDFYKGQFEDFMTGVTGEKARQEILNEIIFLFRLND
jgi:hypothetical protein